ncbi:WASH complex subunit 3 isoform X1 [Manihot esculenta]|uniref:Uncharacterized protein n=1 Tax=Manihot esculenta TaxID=3983 RepID=A0ACB7GVP0_MANES|nr:WASH complex subunit 3 isoform X1 [Manihot esculenta]KAG8643814.1 hypothetical protein MANES_11G068900v8 [Manihot esculenta]
MMMMMMPPPTLFLASTLAFITLLTTAAHARILQDCSLLKATILATYERHLTPPPTPILSPSSHQLTDGYVRPYHHPPPPPKPATPIGQLENIAFPCAQGQSDQPCNNYISMVTDYGRTSISPPPPPMPASPSHPLHRTLQEGSPPSHLASA